MKSQTPYKRFVRRLGKIRPGITLVSVYLLTILLGAGLLTLPISRTVPVDFVDAIFTAASAITITGLNTVDTPTTWTGFGQLVILILIQLGGIGIMSLTTVSFLSGARGSLSLETLYFQELAGSQKISNARELVSKIVIVTFLLEGIGVALILVDLVRYYPFPQALWVSIFHSISAFCNAGFSLIPDSYVSLASDHYFLSVNAALIMCGGFGFLVLVELWDRIRSRKREQRRFTLHLRMVLTVSAILVIGAGSLMWLTEDFDFAQAMFHSVSARSAGFNALDISAVNLPSICLIVVLMYIGTAPGSTGGGIKVTSLATLLALGAQRLRGDNTVTLMRRTIPTPLVIRAVAVALIGVGTITVTTFALVIFQTLDGPAEPNLLRDAIFESTSAVCTVGLSTGLTGVMTTASKLTVTVAMIVGRLGLLTIAYGIAARSRPEKMRYAEGNMMIG